MTGIEPWMGRVAGRALSWLGAEAKYANKLRQLGEQRPLISTLAADRSFEGLTTAQIRGLARYLESPDFEQVALQLTISGRYREGSQWNLRAAAREEVREGIRLFADPPTDRLLTLTDTVFAALDTACAEGPHHLHSVPITAHILAMAARNSRLLARVTELAEHHQKAQRLCEQVVALHSELRLPHTGESRAVPWQDLYVVPDFLPEQPNDTDPPPIARWTTPGSRRVILGDPGAGKSTLATKLAHDCAQSGMVPFLVVLRDFADALRTGERTIVGHLAILVRAPYNIEVSEDTIEYLLFNGQAAVILDGLDELTDVALRRRVTDLVHGFVSLYPLTPILVTSRRIGYGDAPLDRSRFTSCLIAPFSQEQVAQYAGNWFGLNDSLAPSERKRLCQAFLRESEPIEDLRRNPLLLSLLCSMYATEQFIPRNRAQIYERCAVMVFDRWDIMRGIKVPVEFESKVRGAVQQLAWEMFTHGDKPEMSRDGVLRSLVNYLRTKHFDPDDAQDLAERFLAFCAGRAWVLVEVGSTEIQPIYGFAHRTFLEFFVAEHLVRHAPTPEMVWQKLRPRLTEPGWEVVAQLAVQLLDRNLEDGAENLLCLALDETGQETKVLTFAARACGQVGLSPRLLDRITRAAIESFLAIPVQERSGFWVRNDFDRYAAGDLAIFDLMHGSLRGNRPFIRKAIQARITEAPDDTALFLVTRIGRGLLDPDHSDAMWQELRVELEQSLSAEFEAWDQRYPWGLLQRCFDDPDLVDTIVDRFGVAVFYQSDWGMYSANFHRAKSFLVIPGSSRTQLAFPECARRLRARLLATPLPWLPDSWSKDCERMSDLPLWQMGELDNNTVPNEPDDEATFMILTTPYVESDALAFLWTSTTGMSGECAEFLRRWLDGEITVVEGSRPHWVRRRN